MCVNNVTLRISYQTETIEECRDRGAKRNQLDQLRRQNESEQKQEEQQIKGQESTWK